MSDHHNEHIEERDMDLLEELGYEPTDEAANSKLGFHAVFFFTFFFVMVGASYGVLTVLDRVEGFRYTQKQERRVMPPEGTPLLQSNTTAHSDMQDLRKQEHDKLNKYNKNEDGTYTIPVDKAMEIVGERGLPTRADAGVPGDYR